MKTLQKGFTLIELLVVIAIIGILSSVVLASLSSARTRGGDAAVRSELAGMRSQAQLYFLTNGHYGTSSFSYSTGTYDHCNEAGTIFLASSTGGLRNMIVSVSKKAGGTGVPGVSASRVICASTPDARQAQWGVMASTSNGGSWCVDSTGASRAATAFVGGVCGVNSGPAQ